MACSGADHLRGERGEVSLDVSDGWLSAAPSAAAPASAAPASTPPGRRLSEPFRNTYYDFPAEGAGAQSATVFDASCAPIAKVTQEFHDRVCLQGSGRLRGGGTISFAKRDCACAAECPRSGQRICFEKLDPKAFPTGRGSLGKPVTPLRTIAVDSDVLPLGTVVYIPEYDGLPTDQTGKLHDGCFIAEDRGSKVVGRHIDVFTGDPSMTQRWNQLVPSNVGVRLELSSPRCAHLLAPP
jgi:3D (Asp-Asp-Asp) domain-containing protein